MRQSGHSGEASQAGLQRGLLLFRNILRDPRSGLGHIVALGLLLQLCSFSSSAGGSGRRETGPVRVPGGISHVRSVCFSAWTQLVISEHSWLSSRVCRWIELFGHLTSPPPKTRLGVERAFTFRSFRFPELSQPI